MSYQQEMEFKEISQKISIALEAQKKINEDQKQNHELLVSLYNTQNIIMKDLINFSREHQNQNCFSENNLNMLLELGHTRDDAINALQNSLSLRAAFERLSPE